MKGDTPVRLVVLGGGNRGRTLAQYALLHPDRTRVVAVAEPHPGRRAYFAEAHGLPPHRLYEDWRALLEEPRLGEAALLTLPDALHAEAAVALLEKGYHVLLEKPVATTLEDLDRVEGAWRRSGRMVAVAHVLRYTPYARGLKALLEEGVIGHPVSLQHLEPVGHWHFAHSYVRGNWREEKASSPFLLAKAVHDLDWILFLMPGEVARMASFGGLYHFRPENRPKGAGERCLSCPEEVERACPFSARRIYLEAYDRGERGWPLDVVAFPLTREALLEALWTGPYGECVYLGKNDVADHQAVLLEYRDGRTASFHAEALSRMRFRETRLFGTEGELWGDGESVRVFRFLEGERVYRVGEGREGSLRSGHGGGDMGLMADFVEAVAREDPSRLEAFEEALYAHRLTLLAEQSRREGRTVDL
ncbi:putative dehydrogenase (plasmid) [Thermus oshimai JL-2]|uniref:Putative dehydrogenase n=1 Tax=Thermus oshimai JL-2 TaxID=751945 RepID=K7QWY1_THEOS|nr:Gfo/Idh/MocA family oxidoreductase [Thermus oshimai]AFV77411.1 putative dehydrogenase [Thermus oshimai JL-2]